MDMLKIYEHSCLSLYSPVSFLILSLQEKKKEWLKPIMTASIYVLPH
jgi:hypothetical protein